MNSLPPSISRFRSASIAPATPCKGMRRNPRRRGGKAPSDAASTALRAPRALNACATPRHAAPQPVGGRRVLARVLTDARSHEHGSAAPRPPPGACAGRHGVGTLARSRRPGLRPPSNLRRCPDPKEPVGAVGVRVGVYAPDATYRYTVSSTGFSFFGRMPEHILLRRRGAEVAHGKMLFKIVPGAQVRPAGRGLGT